MRILLSCLLALSLSPAFAADATHGLTLTDTLKYPAGFAKFDYVNAAAPKTGTLKLAVEGAFDTLNPVSPRGVSAPGLGMVYDTLMKRAYDEISSEYGLIAEKVTIAPNITAATFTLNSAAKWHDGTPITPEDVVFSFNAWKKNSMYTTYYASIKKAEKTGVRDVTFTFDAPNNKELPHILGQMIVLSKAFWSAKDSKGNPRDIAAPSSDLPLGSGPYRVKSIETGRNITYERVPNYWAETLNVNVGYNNFQEIKYTVYRDDSAQILDFKADRLDARLENRAKNWATAYDFPAIKNGRAIKATFERRATGEMQGFVPNMRREKFQDARVRQALNYMLDFEHLNRSIFYNQYERCNSYYAGTELASSGLPEGKELEILKALKYTIPSQVLTTPYTNPVGGDEANARNNMRTALELFKAAGWQLQNGKMRNAKGEAFTLEIMIASPAFSPIAEIYGKYLEKIGVEASVRQIDPTQYISRLRTRDYDMVVGHWGQSLTPGNEQRTMWSTQASEDGNSQNLAGIKNPAVDALVEQIIYAPDRATQVAATKALDRVLLWNHYVIPQWRISYDRIAHWNRFAYPSPIPAYAHGFPDIWWAK